VIALPFRHGVVNCGDSTQLLKQVWALLQEPEATGQECGDGAEARNARHLGDEVGKSKF
jgi:hypothetical protein